MRSLRPDSTTGHNFLCGVQSVNRPPVTLSHRWILSGFLCLTGSALFISAFPPWNLGLVTGWLAVVPLIAAVAGSPALRAAFFGWLFGLTVNLGIFAWLFVVPGFRWYHFLLLNAYLALYPALWCMIVARLVHNSMTAQIGVACAWVLIDYVRAHAGFLALPWITLAQSQIDNAPLLQVAPLFGEPGVTFLVVLGNLTIWNLANGWLTRCAWLGVLPVLGAMTLGAYLLTYSGTVSEPTIKVAALGTDFSARVSPAPDLQKQLDARIEYFQKTLPSDVEIVAWPESALINPQQFPGPLDQLQQLVKHKQVTLVTGVAEATKFDHRLKEPSLFDTKLRSGARLITPDDHIPQQYEKTRLVPFAETMPLKGWVTWPVWLITPIPEVIPGPAPRSYPVPGGVRVGIMICWESLFADHTRALIHDGATLLVMLSNEGWFADPAGAQHNLTARMRAAETQRSVVVSSNMGPPLVIDPFGRVIAGNSLDSGMRWATADVPIVTEKTFYSSFGDVFVLLCGMFILVFIATRLRMRRV
ncbi:MAG: apolipoprotein N-acyltransferase [Nitrospirales bacterium]